MQHVFADSTSISSAEYNEDDETLSITFNSGKTYKYDKVPKSVYIELTGAKSAGRFFQAYIKPYYKVIND